MKYWATWWNAPLRVCPPPLFFFFFLPRRGRDHYRNPSPRFYVGSSRVATCVVKQDWKHCVNLCTLQPWIPTSSALDYSIKTLGLWNPRSSVLESCTTRRSLVYRIPVSLLLVFQNTDVLLSRSLPALAYVYYCTPCYCSR